jgi:hypothetical protein
MDALLKTHQQSETAEDVLFFRGLCRHIELDVAAARIAVE